MAAVPRAPEGLIASAGVRIANSSACLYRPRQSPPTSAPSSFGNVTIKQVEGERMTSALHTTRARQEHNAARLARLPRFRMQPDYPSLRLRATNSTTALNTLKRTSAPVLASELSPVFTSERFTNWNETLLVAVSPVFNQAVPL